MTTTSPAVAISPNGGVHAVRAGAAATACGLDYRRTRRRNQAGRRSWLLLRQPFTAAVHQVCKRCVECLAEGMGPGAKEASVR